MGLNLNIAKMFNLPTKVDCPTCKTPTNSFLNDFDIECYSIKNGVLIYTLVCDKCKKEFHVTVSFQSNCKTS